MKIKYILFLILSGIGVAYYLNTPKHTVPHQTLTIAFDAKIMSADPRMIGSDAASQYIEELRFLPLISFDSSGNRIHVLADTLIARGTRISITIKKGVHFANGDEITVQDVFATYQAIMTPRDGFPPSPRKGAFADVDSLKIKGQTLVFTLKKLDASFVNNLNIGILPKKVVESEEIGSLENENYESGPFLLTAVKEMEWCFKRNDKFDYAKLPALQSFNIRVIPDSSTRYAALMRGDVDIIQNSLDPDKINLIETKMKNTFHVLKSTKLATTYIGFNFKDPVLAKKSVRLALAYALDRENILRYRLRSQEMPATGMFIENSFYFDPNLSALPYEKDKANNLLNESGLKLPVKLALKVSNSNKTNVEIAKTMSVNLREVGFDVKIETLENGVFLQHVNRGLVQMWLAPWVGFKDPDHLRFVFASTMVPPYGANRGHYSNAELDGLLEKGRVELEPSKRKRIYLKAQELIAEDMPYLYLWHGTNTVVTSKRVHGFAPYADGRYWSLVNTTFE